MKSNISKMGSLFISSLLVLSGCTDSNLGSGINLSSTQGLTAGKAGDADSAVFGLSDEEVALSRNSSYISIQETQNLKSQLFNRQQWPKICSGSEDTKGLCSVDSKGKIIGLRDIKVTGQIVVIDANQFPWNLLNKGRNIRSVQIEADKILLKSKIQLPGTNVQIMADHFYVGKDGVIDVTPDSTGADVAPAFGLDLSQSPLKDEKGQDLPYNGKDGVKGSLISVWAESAQFESEQEKIHFIARGADGEAAGKGRGQTAEELANKPNYAASMTPITRIPDSLRQYAKSIVYSTEYIKDGRVKRIGHSDASTEIWYPVIESALGLADWPKDGVDAISGGYPGAGGEGGEVQFHLKTRGSSLEKTVDVGVGKNGAPDVTRKGSLGGLPNPAYHIIWSGGRATVDGVWVDKPSLKEHRQKDGKEAIPPQSPRKENAPGKIQVEDLGASTNLVHSRDYFEISLMRIKDLYFVRNFEQTVQATNRMQSQLDVAKKRNGDLVGVSSQLNRITQSLANQKDFFGRGLQDVPVYAFNFNATSFNAKLDRMLRAYYLAKVFQKRFANSENRQKDMNELIQVMDQNIADSVSDIKQSFDLINQIITEINQAQLNQAAIEKELQTINEQIKTLAKSNVEVRKRAAEFSRFVDVAAAVCQVIPAGQPALGIAATLAKTMVKGPEDTSVEGWVKYYKNVKGQFDGYEKKADFEKSKASFAEFKDKFDMKHLRDQNFEDKVKYLSGLYDELSPSIDKISESLMPLSQPVLPADELQREIAKIQTSDPVFEPMFSSITKKLNDLIERKMKIQQDLLVVSTSVSNAVSNISNYVAIASKYSELSSSEVWYDDGILAQTFNKLASSSEEELLRMYAELISSYQYLTLDNAPQEFSILEVRRKMEVIIANENVDQSLKSLKEFYLSPVDQLKDRLDNMINRGDSLLNTREGYVLRKLTRDEVRQLNKDGYVDIPLAKHLYAGYENTRITDLSLDQGYRFEGEGSQAQNAYLVFDMTLGNRGTVDYRGRLYSFTYPNVVEGRSLFKWRHQFRFGSDVNHLESISHPYSNQFEGIVETVTGVQGNGKIKTLFSSHAAETTVRINKFSSSGPYRVKDLTLRVNYIFSM